jgi:chaperonin cofactor prefoldin
MVFLMDFGTAGSKIVYVLYAPMAFAAVVGIILFRMVIAEARDEESDDEVDPESEIKELKTSLKKYEERIQELEEKLNEGD